jgi:hypothetical protein
MDFDLWDICFAFNFNISKEPLGFNGRWYLPKLSPFLEFLNYNKCDLRISYKKIIETNNLSLQDIISFYGFHIKTNNLSLQDIKSSNSYDMIEKIENNGNFIYEMIMFEGYNFSFDDCKTDEVIKCKIISLEDIANFNIDYYQKIKKKDKKNILKILNSLGYHFFNGYPFFTLYLPENIKEFEEVYRITEWGCEDADEEYKGYTRYLAKSKDYFYFFQYGIYT